MVTNSEENISPHRQHQSEFRYRRSNMNPLEQQDKLSVEEKISFPALVLTIISFICFICNFGNDLATAGVLQENNRLISYYVTLVFAIVPMIIANFFSITLYTRKSSEEGKTERLIWFSRIFCHFLQLGSIQRRVETIFRGIKYSIKPSSCYKRTSKSRSKATIHYQSYAYQSQCLVYMNLIQCVLHDIPQLLLQTFVWIAEAKLNKPLNSDITPTSVNCTKLCKTLMTSFAFSLFSLITAIVSYQQNVRFTLEIAENSTIKDQTFAVYILEFIWRLGTTGSRIFVISLAVATLDLDSSLSYLAVITFHWLIYTIYFKNKNKEIRRNPFIFTFPEHAAVDSGRVYILGIVHVFCFFDDRRKVVKLANGRLLTFYVFALTEDTCLFAFWYCQYYLGFHNPKIITPWIFKVAYAIYYVPAFVGIIAMVLYFYALKQSILPAICRAITKGRYLLFSF